MHKKKNTKKQPSGFLATS